MDSIIKKQVDEISEKSSSVYTLFKKSVDEMGFTELVSVSSFLHAMQKRLKERRKEIGNIIDNKIENGSVENRVIEESKSGKSTKVVMPGFKVSRVKGSSSKRATVGNLKEMLKSKGLEEQTENLLIPEKEEVNKNKLDKILEDNDIDRNDVYDVKRWSVDEEKLKALSDVSQDQNIGFVITDDDVESVYEEVKSSSYTKCTLDKEKKKEVIDSLRPNLEE